MISILVDFIFFTALVIIIGNVIVVKYTYSYVLYRMRKNEEAAINPYPPSDFGTVNTSTVV